MSEKQLNNLIPQNKRTKKEQREIAIQGGIASGKVRKAKKTFAALAQAMLDCKAHPEEIKNLKKEFPLLNDEELNNKAVMIRRQIFKAVTEGDTKAFEILRDTIGEKPKDNLNITGAMKTKVIQDDI